VKKGRTAKDEKEGKKKKIEEEKMSKKFCKKGVAPNFFLIHRGGSSFKKQIKNNHT